MACHGMDRDRDGPRAHRRGDAAAGARLPDGRGPRAGQGARRRQEGSGRGTARRPLRPARRARAGGARPGRVLDGAVAARPGRGVPRRVGRPGVARDAHRPGHRPDRRPGRRGGPRPRPLRAPARGRVDGRGRLRDPAPAAARRRAARLAGTEPHAGRRAGTPRGVDASRGHGPQVRRGRHLRVPGRPVRERRRVRAPRARAGRAHQGGQGAVHRSPATAPSSCGPAAAGATRTGSGGRST